MNKRIYLLAGLPRSGSTLLANIMAQHPDIHVTPTSGILDMLVQVRNAWDLNEAFRAADRVSNQAAKQRVLRAMFESYFAHSDRPVSIDKNRYWAEYLEMAAELVGGRDRVKIIVTVRDLRDVLASFEQLYRTTSALGQVQTDPAAAVKFRTAQGRVETFLDAVQPVGRAYIAIRDALTRGWNDRMHFVDYDEFTRQPKRTLSGIYEFLGEKPHDHDFERVEQVTFEDDFVYGFKDLHRIRPQVKPQPPLWPHVFDDSVFDSPAWKNVENAAAFWKAYQKAR
jgi:sulfotransferase